MANTYTISKIQLPNGDVCNIKDTVTTVTTDGSSGNAVTAISANNGELTVTKGQTFLTEIIAGNGISVSGNQISVNLENLGLSKALRFIGQATDSLVLDDNNRTNQIPQINGLNSYTPQIGDVILDSESNAEFVCIKVEEENNNDLYTWERLGRDSSWALDNEVIKKNGTAGDILYWSNTDSPTHLTKGSDNSFLTIDETNHLPSWTTTIPKSAVGLDNVTNNAQVHGISWNIANKELIYQQGNSSNVLLSFSTDDLDLISNNNSLKINLPIASTTQKGGIKVGSGLTISNEGVLSHADNTTAGSFDAGNNRTLSFGNSFNIPSITYDEKGHITETSTTILTLPSAVDEKVKQTAVNTDYWYRALLTNANSISAEPTQLNNDATAQEANYSTKIAIQPSSGTLRANKIRIDEDSSSLNPPKSPSNVVLSYNATDNSLDFIFTYVAPTET